MVAVAPGRQIGPYRVVERIGRGGSAVVYRALDAAGREVAVKVIAGAHAADPTFMARFRQEAQLITRLHHPHILPVLDSAQGADDDDDALAYLVTEYMPGGSLADRLGQARSARERGQLAVEVAEQIGAALDWAHAMGVLHRDVKPSNVLIAGDGRYVLGDFGLARVLQAGASLHLTVTGLVAGTPAYMAPEQALGELADARTDVYGLAVVLFEVLCGRVPFQAETPLAVMLAHVHQPPPRARTLAPDLPRQVEAVLDRSLSKARENRYHSGTELARSLRAAVAGSLGEATLATGVAPAVPVRPARAVGLRQRMGFAGLLPARRPAGAAIAALRPKGVSGRVPRLTPGTRARAGRLRRWLLGAVGAVAVSGLASAGAAGVALGPGRPLLTDVLSRYVADGRALPPEDATTPHVMEAFPRNGARGLQLQQSFSVRFSHPMEQESVGAALRIDPAVPLALAWDGQLLVITPETSLDPATTYQLSIGTEALDVEGRPLARPLQIRFSTIDPPKSIGQVVAAPLPEPTPVPPPPATAEPRPSATTERRAPSATATVRGSVPPLATLYTPPTVVAMGPDESLVLGYVEAGPGGTAAGLPTAVATAAGGGGAAPMATTAAIPTESVTASTPSPSSVAMGTPTAATPAAQVTPGAPGATGGTETAPSASPTGSAVRATVVLPSATATAAARQTTTAAAASTRTAVSGWAATATSAAVSATASSAAATATSAARQTAQPTGTAATPTNAGAASGTQTGA